MKKKNKYLLFISTIVILFYIFQFFSNSRKDDINKKTIVLNKPIPINKMLIDQEKSNFKKKTHQELPKQEEASQNHKTVFKKIDKKELELISLASYNKRDPKIIKKFILQAKGIKDRKQLIEIANIISKEDFFAAADIISWIDKNYPPQKKNIVIEKKKVIRSNFRKD